MARPMPEVEPVTSATLPSRIMRISFAALRRVADAQLQPSTPRKHYGMQQEETACGSATSPKAAISRTGPASGGGCGFGGGGGNALGCLLPLVASRFGIGGVVVLVLGYFLLSSLGGSAAAAELVPARAADQRASGPEQRSIPNTRDFLLQVLGSTEDTWGEIFPKAEPLHADDAGRLFRRRPVGLRRGAGGDGAVLLPDRQEDLPRHRILQRAVAALPGARRLRHGLCHRA